jgi:hypothetical protein
MAVELGPIRPAKQMPYLGPPGLGPACTLEEAAADLLPSDHPHARQTPSMSVDTRTGQIWPTGGQAIVHTKLIHTP